MDIIEIEKIFDNFLLYNIEVKHLGKDIKKGRLKMVVVKNHNIKFLIETSTGIKNLELLYPFNIIDGEDIKIFDYNIPHTIKENKELYSEIENYSTEPKSKYINTKVIFKKI